MFGPITLPSGAKMLFNTVMLKPNVTFEDVELAVGELCMVIKETYGGDKGGVIADGSCSVPRQDVLNSPNFISRMGDAVV